MKRCLMIAAVAGAAVAGATGAAAYDRNSKTSFSEEWQTHLKRINEGRKSGVLSRAEARVLRREHNALGALPYSDSTKAKLSRESKRIAAYKTS
jgi:hypothetical protein